MHKKLLYEVSATYSNMDNEEKQNTPYDQIYKRFFGDPAMVQSLVKSMVSEEFYNELDFTDIRQVATEHVTEHLRKRFNDLIWQIRWRDTEWCYVYLMLEFQRTADYWMAVRMMSYTALFWLDLIKTTKPQPKYLPPVLPIVIYNGDTKWNAPTRVQDLLPPALKGFVSSFQPDMRFLLLDAGHLPKKEWKEKDSLLALLLKTERIRTSEDMSEVLNLMGHNLEAYPSLLETFLHYVYLAYKKAGLADPEHQFSSIEEANDMLLTNAVHWGDRYREEGLEEGLAKGRAEGISIGKAEGRAEGRAEGISIGEVRATINTLKMYLKSRFGEIPEFTLDSIAGIQDVTTLNNLTEQAFQSHSLDEFHSVLRQFVKQ